MKHKLILAVALASLFFLTSCTKESTEKTIAWYKYFGLEEMQYITGEDDEFIEFVTGLGAVLDEYSGTFFTDSELTKSIDKVVDAYDNGVIQGTFCIKRSTSSEDGPWTTVKSWTMTVNKKYRN